MELEREQHSHTGARVHISSGPRGDESARDPVDGVPESRILQARADAGRSARTSTQIHPGCGASVGTSGCGTSDRMDACIRGRHGRELSKFYFLWISSLFMSCRDLCRDLTYVQVQNFCRVEAEFVCVRSFSRVCATGSRAIRNNYVASQRNCLRN